MKSNYDISKERAAALFLSYKQEELIKRFGLEADALFLYPEFLGSACRIERASGACECYDAQSDMFREASFEEALTVYDLLCYSKPYAKPAGSFVMMESLSAVFRVTSSGGTAAYYKKLARAFDGQPEKFFEIMSHLGGVPVSGGDACAELVVFGELKARLRLWFSDDEFPAQLQFLWDANVLDFMHFETVWYANSAIESRCIKMLD